MSETPATAAIISERPSTATSSAESPAPVAWAERPPVESLRNPKPQKMKEKISAPTAMAPM